MRGDVRLPVWTLSALCAAGAVALVWGTLDRGPADPLPGGTGTSAARARDAGPAADPSAAPTRPAPAPGGPAAGGGAGISPSLPLAPSGDGDDPGAGRVRSDAPGPSPLGIAGRTPTPEGRRAPRTVDAADLAFGTPPAGRGDPGARVDPDPSETPPTRDAAEPEAPRPELVRLEEDAARVAEALGLVSPELLQLQIERRAPDGSLPGPELARAREDARRQILADAAIVEDLVRQRHGGRADYPAAGPERGLAQTLLSASGTEFREKRLRGVAQRLE